MYDKHRHEVEFFLIYVSEAHPQEQQWVENERDDVYVDQPKDIQHREANARAMCQRMELSIPTLVDGLDNVVCNTYRAWPYRGYVIDRHGKVAYQSPFMEFRAETLAKAIANVLSHQRQRKFVARLACEPCHKRPAGTARRLFRPT